MADNSLIITSNTSAIAFFAASRSALLQAADEANRDLTADEGERVRVWGEAIAHLPARTAEDATAQIEVMREQVQLCEDGVAGPDAIAQAHAALCSARQWLRPQSADTHA